MKDPIHSDGKHQPYDQPQPSGNGVLRFPEGAQHPVCILERVGRQETQDIDTAREICLPSPSAKIVIEADNRIDQENGQVDMKNR